MKILKTVNEWATANPLTNIIFDGVTIFEDKPLFDIFNFRYGDCVINYPLSEIDVVSDTEIAALTAIITDYYESYKYKYDGLQASEKFEYNPIENYRMTETEETTREPDLQNETTYNTTDKISYNTNNTINHTDTTTTTTSKPKVSIQTGTTTTNKVTAFDVDTFANDTHSDTQQTITPLLNNGEGDTQTEKLINDTPETNTKTGFDENKKTGKDTTTETGTDTTNRELTRAGNIGVTTSQQMIESERKLRDFSAVNLFLNDVANYILLNYN